MKIGVVGAGPAGLYLALLAARVGHQITVFERNPEGATYGWGVVFSEGTLNELAEIDYLTYHDLDRELVRWSAIDIHRRGSWIRSYGQPFSAISRRTLLGVLHRRAIELGVEIRHETFADPDQMRQGGFDLVVAADGINSTIRTHHQEAFGPTFDVHPTRYIWLGLPRAFPAFTFIFEETEHGLFQVHGYPYDSSGSTFIVECTEEVWQRAGLADMGEAESVAFCEKVFSDHLEGSHLLSNRSTWNTFVTLRNRSWHLADGAGPSVVLVGDAAHTAHFSIGSGTKLAMEDAAALYKALTAHPLPAALVEYEAERQPPVGRFQEAARDSARYFEGVTDLLDLDHETFGFTFLTPSGRISHLDMQRRDPALTLAADRKVAGVPSGEAVSEPALSPLSIGGIVLENRLVGEVGDQSGAGLALYPTVAVSADGRAFPAQSVVGATLLAPVPGAPFGVVIGHAGPRGSCRPPEDGLDRPLLGDGWETRACSPIAYTSAHRLSREMTRLDFDEVEAAFEAGAAWARAQKARLLVIDAARGNLLAGFLSPLTNQRSDEFGADLAGRLRFPMKVIAAVREVWSGPLAVRFSATDWHKQGTTQAEAVAIAAAFRSGGVDLVEVCGGGTIARVDPPYRRGFLLPLASAIRNRARIPVLVGGGLTTLDDINTALAGGRADLLRLDPYRYRRPLQPET